MKNGSKVIAFLLLTPAVSVGLFFYANHENITDDTHEPTRAQVVAQWQVEQNDLIQQAGSVPQKTQQ